MVASSNLVGPIYIMPTLLGGSIAGQVKMPKKKAKFTVKSHILIPKHSKLSQKEKNELFDRFNVTQKELPKISMDDPAILGMNLKPGDVIKIERQSATAGSAVYYRGVVGE